MKTILLTLIPLVFFACSPKIITDAPSGVFFIESTAPEIVSLRATGFGKSLAKAEEDAIKRLFEAIMFQGIPKFTALSKPMVTSEKEFHEKAPDFMDKFIEDGIYERFVTSQFDPELTDNRKGKRISKDMTVHYGNFRRYLESKNLTRKFGY